MHIQTCIHDRGLIRVQIYAEHSCEIQMRQVSSWLLSTEDSRQDGGWELGNMVSALGKKKREQGNYPKGVETWVQLGQPAVPSPPPSREWSSPFLSIWDVMVLPTVLDWPGWLSLVD